MLTGISITAMAISMAVAWLITKHHMQDKEVLPQVRHMSRFFLSMALFFVPMASVHLTLLVAPEAFPDWMTFGYIAGHVFLYIALAYLARMMTSLSPRLAHFEMRAFTAWLVVGATLTLLNILLPNTPTYDSASGVSLLNAHPLIGVLIPVFVTISMFPLAILFLRAASHSHGVAKTRSLIWGVAFIILMIGGPIHDFARSWPLFLLSDLLSLLAIILITYGVVLEVPATRPEQEDMAVAQ